MSEKYLSKSAFAALQGWSPSYVTKLGHMGRLVFSSNPRLIDVEATLENLGSMVDPGKAYLREYHARVRIAKHVTAHIQPDATTDDETSAGPDPKYWACKARRENALADLAAMELENRRSALVDRKSVEAMALTVEKTLREAVLCLPPQLAPIFATMPDAFEIEVKLRDALRQVFADAARMTANELAGVRLTAQVAE